jgi:hypothetical protein
MKPSFLVAGVAKCGTTSLFYYLDQHPEICIPKKETFYFIADHYRNQTSDKKGQRELSRVIFTKQKYDALYSKCKNGISGEVSTCYVYYHDEAIPKIKETLGDIPVIIILREPVSRLISGYKHFQRLEKENLDFDSAIQAEEARKKKGYDFMWQYRGLGFYADAVKHYLDSFSKVKVILMEDLQQQPLQTMQEIFRFIGVDDKFKPDTSVQYNISDPQTHNFWFRLFFRNKLIKPLLDPVVKKLFSDKLRRKIQHRFRKKSTTAPAQPDEKIIAELKAAYRGDILRLQSLIQRDLSSWLK